MSGDAIVTVENLIKDFRPGFGVRRKRVLHGISFRVHRGEIFGFVGPNGSGKTTTLKVLMGLIRATGGRASVLGSDVGEIAYRRQVGFLPENPCFYDFLTGREILHFYARLSGLAGRDRAHRVDALLDWVGLAAAGDAQLRTYSKGMLQRVGIAQALVHDPTVVFLDEPMSGLDPIGRKEVRDVILRLRGEGKTVFMNTHILPDVEMVCDRVAIIVKGQIRHESSTDELLSGGPRVTDVVLARLPAPIASELEERHGARLRGLGERIEVCVQEKELQVVLQRAIAAGAEVISVTPQRTSLESVFLSAVEAGTR